MYIKWGGMSVRKGIQSIVKLTITMLLGFIILFPASDASAEIADGSYQINYEMKGSGNNNTSIADGYFTKPATLTVKDGIKHIQLNVTSSSMIKSLSVPSGEVTVVREGNDTRTVKFRVDGDLSQPLSMKMRIVVPDMPEMPGGYKQDHTARAIFNVSDLPQAETGASALANDAGQKASESKTVSPADNPPTNDDTPIVLYAGLLLASVAIFSIYKLRTVKNN